MTQADDKIVHIFFNLTLLCKKQKNLCMCENIYLEKNLEQCCPVQVSVKMEIP